MTPRHLFEFCQENITQVKFSYSSTKDYEEESGKLESRFGLIKTLPGTQKLHSFIPNSMHELEVKTFSHSSHSKIASVSIYPSQKNPLENINGYVTVEYDGHWWLACVLAVNQACLEVKVSFLHPAGPSPSFTYPTHPDVLVVKNDQILTTVDPVTSTGRTYQLPTVQMEKATFVLSSKY